MVEFTLNGFLVKRHLFLFSFEIELAPNRGESKAVYGRDRVRDLYVVCMWAGWYMCVKYERFRRCKGGKNRINAPSVANFALKLKNNAAEERVSY